MMQHMLLFSVFIVSGKRRGTGGNINIVFSKND